MTLKLIIKSCGIGNYEWLQLENDSSVVVVGDSERLAEAALSASSCTLIYPSENVSFRQVEFDSGERKIIGQTVPYALEDDLIDDVENLHFSFGVPQENKVPVAIAVKTDIDNLLLPFQHEKIDLKHVIPELFFLPRENNGWSMFVDADTWTVRSSQYQGFSINVKTANLALQLLLDESESLPEKFTVFGAGKNTNDVASQLPELLRGIVRWSDDDYWVMIENGTAGKNVTTDVTTDSDELATNSQLKAESFTPINFLQGNYAISLPWLKWWKSWQLTAVLLLVAVISSLVSGYIRVSVLEQRNLDLRKDIELAYRSVVPKGAIMDAETQLRRKVNAARGQTGEGFVSLFNKIGIVLAQTKELSLQSLNYNARQSEVRVTVIADNFVDVERARSKLEKAGLSAQLTGSSSEGNKTRARLKIKG